MTTLYIHSKTYEQGTQVRDTLRAHLAQNTGWKLDTLFHDNHTDKDVILGFWWKADLDDKHLNPCRAVLSQIDGTVVQTEPPPVPII